MRSWVSTGESLDRSAEQMLCALEELSAELGRLDAMLSCRLQAGWRGQEATAFAHAWHDLRGLAGALFDGARETAVILRSLARFLEETGVVIHGALEEARWEGLVVVDEGRPRLEAFSAQMDDVRTHLQQRVDSALDRAARAEEEACARWMELATQAGPAWASIAARGIRIAASAARQLEARTSWWTREIGRTSSRLEMLAAEARPMEATLARYVQESREATATAARLSRYSELPAVRALRWAPRVAVLERVPGVGYAATAISVTADVMQGDDWRLALLRESLGVAAGALTAFVLADLVAGTCLAGTAAGPVIVVAGAAVAGYVVADEAVPGAARWLMAPRPSSTTGTRHSRPSRSTPRS